MNPLKQLFFSFKEAKEFVHSFKLKSIKKWKAYCEENNISDIPPSLKAFREAREYVRVLKPKN